MVEGCLFRFEQKKADFRRPWVCFGALLGFDELWDKPS